VNVNFVTDDDDNADVGVNFDTDEDDNADVGVNFDTDEDDNADVGVNFDTDDDDNADVGVNFDTGDDDNADVGVNFDTDDDDNADVGVNFDTNDAPTASPTEDVLAMSVEFEAIPTESYYCGVSYDDASEQCTIPCPSKTSSECPGNQQCFAFTPCAKPESFFCGQSFEDASGSCTLPCSTGKVSCLMHWCIVCCCNSCHFLTLSFPPPHFHRVTPVHPVNLVLLTPLARQSLAVHRKSLVLIQ
jgi:hypothetical protein